jgi:hypothetical protein
MRPIVVALALAMALPAGAASAAGGLQIRGAALRVAIVPERRSDVRLTVLRTNPRLPLRIRTMGGRVVITGDVNRRVRGCGGGRDPKGVDLWGRGRIAYDALPFIVVRTPLDVHVTVGDAVFGVIGRSASVDFTNQGCGDWTIANVRGRLSLDQAGAGDARTGSAASAELSVAGSGRIGAGAIQGGLKAVSSGSGDINVALVHGPVDVRVAGTGGVDIAGGAARHMEISIAGSGDVRMGGSAQSLTASVTGTGDVVVAHVDGPVVRRLFGSGQIKVGP